MPVSIVTKKIMKPEQISLKLNSAFTIYTTLCANVPEIRKFPVDWHLCIDVSMCVPAKYYNVADEKCFQKKPMISSVEVCMFISCLSICRLSLIAMLSFQYRLHEC